MSIAINGSRKLYEIQNDFNAVFPYLKIEFFKAPHKIGESNTKNQLHDLNKAVSDCRMKNAEGFIEFNELTTVGELEARFYDDFGLSAQVFRKSGNVWLETSATDSWTLRQQNEEGAELSRKIEPARENPDDSDIY